MSDNSYLGALEDVGTSISNYLSPSLNTSTPTSSPAPTQPAPQTSDSFVSATDSPVITPFDTSTSANNVVTDTSSVHTKITNLNNALTTLQNDTTGAGFAGGSAFPNQTGNASGYTRDTQGNIYDATGKYVDYASLPKGTNGQPLMNLQTLPIGQYSGGALKSGIDTRNNNGNYSAPFDSQNGTILPPGYSRNQNGLIVDSTGTVKGYNSAGTNYNTDGSIMTGTTTPSGTGGPGGTPTPPIIPTAPNYGQFTPDQQKRIDDAGSAAGGQFDNLIADAMNNKNQGLAKSEVAAGEKGGFMNTQFAGLSAVLPTQGHTFEGQGGQLQNIQGTYDRQIAQLQVQKNAAITAAKNAMQDYINTGNQKSYDNAMTSYNAAVAANKDAMAAADDKVTQLQKWADLQQTLNKPLTDATKAMQDYAYTQMAKYPSAFTNLTADQLKTITPAQINTMITGSKEYKDEVLKAHNEALKAGFVPGTQVSIGGTTYANSAGGGAQAVDASGNPIAGSTLTSDSVNFWAQAAASGVNTNSLLPSLGMGAAAVGAKTRLLNQMAMNAKTLGIDGSTFAAMVADSKAKQATYTQLQKVGSQTQVNEATANANFQQLVGLSQKLDASSFNTAIPLLNEYIRSGVLKTTGNADINNFNALLASSLTEYAKVVSGQTSGSAVSDTMNAQLQKMLSSGMNSSTIQSFANTAKQEMSNRTSSYDSALKGLFGNIQSLNDTSGGLGGTQTEQGIGSIPAADIAGAKQYVQAAIADKANYPNREALEQDILKHNPGYKLDDIANLVQSIWTDNLSR